MIALRLSPKPTAKIFDPAGQLTEYADITAHKLPLSALSTKRYGRVI